MLGMGLPLFPDKLCIAVCGRAGASKFLEVLFSTLAAHLQCRTLCSRSQISLASSHALPCFWHQSKRLPKSAS